MGQAASAIVNALDRSKEDEMKAKEQLELMMKLADARLNTFEGELKSMFLDHESAMKTSVPGKRALRFERYVQVDTESTVCISVYDLGHCLGASNTMNSYLTMYNSRATALTKLWTLFSVPATRA